MRIIVYVLCLAPLPALALQPSPISMTVNPFNAGLGMVKGTRSLINGAFAGGPAPLELGRILGRQSSQDNGHRRWPFALTRQQLSVHANSGVLSGSKRGRAAASLRRLVMRMQSSPAPSVVSESSSSSSKESSSNGNDSNGGGTPGAPLATRMIAKGLGMPPTAPLDSATAAAEAEATAKREASLRHQAMAQMRAYLWPRGDLRTKTLLLTSLALLIAGKVVNAQVPFVLQAAVDGMSKGAAGVGATAAVTAPLGLFALYGFSRAFTVALTELKTMTFAHVNQRALRRFSNAIFAHLHVLDSKFHSAHPSGLLSVAYVRGVRGFQAILFQLVFAVVPTLVELFITATVLTQRCGEKYALATLATFVAYCAYTSWITEWRMKIRRNLVSVDNERNAYFVDAMANAETVKLFGNEPLEHQRFDNYLGGIQKYNIENTFAIAVLNVGQALIFSAGLTAVMLFTASEVSSGVMTVGSIVAVNGLLLQLQHPFNSIGHTYQEIRQGFVDMHLMLEMLQRSPEVIDTVGIRVRTEEAAAAFAVREQELAQAPPWTRLAAGFAPRTYGLGGSLGSDDYFSTPSSTSSSTSAAATSSSSASSTTSSNSDSSSSTSDELSQWLSNEPNRLKVATQAADAEIAAAVQEVESLRAEVAALESQAIDAKVVDSVEGSQATTTAITTSATTASKTTEAAVPTKSGSLEFKNVSFSYGEGLGMQVKEVSFAVAPGQTVALVGASGSGKSTVLRLVTRLHDVTSGAVLLDGVDVKTLPVATLRACVGVVSQDTTLFDNSVAYNIRYGNTSATDAEVVAAAKAAQVHDSIERTPDGYATRVGERGAKLSGGERQRVAIARTLLRQPAVMLCDEVTSALDAETEASIVSALRVVNQDRTCVIVAHRLASVAHADCILVMNQGKIVERGTHKELIAMKGYYNKMWTLQHADPDITEEGLSTALDAAEASEKAAASA